MSRRSLDCYLAQGTLCCPACRGDLGLNGECLVCGACGVGYPVLHGIPRLVSPESPHADTRREMQTFWGALYRAAYEAHPEEHDADAFVGQLDDLERLFAHRRHLAAVEMPLEALRGVRVLEIGSGAGAHSALFAARGAEVTSVDLTAERVVATARKLDWVPTAGHFVLQADAERLPLREASFDIVYSNGVLHHTPDTRRAVTEVHRVLRPGGRAVVMLYARHSLRYWVNLFLLYGVLGGHRRRPGWLGAATDEWMASGPAPATNPESKVYSGREVRRLFGAFRSVRVRKNSFTFDAVLSPLAGTVPRLGPRLRARLLRRLEARQGLDRAGMLVYGAPWRRETRTELALGRLVGFGLNIVAVK